MELHHEKSLQDYESVYNGTIQNHLENSPNTILLITTIALKS